MESIKNIALIAHDNRKRDLAGWVEWNYHTLIFHNLICTGTTGQLVEKTIIQKIAEAPGGSEISLRSITKLKSGPLGGDQQIGAMIAQGEIDILIFFWDPMEPQPHDVDVKALLRIAVLYNIPTACNRSTADFVISSSLLSNPYQQITRDYEEYITRKLDLYSGD